MSLRSRLSTMMFLEYAVWGAWTTVGAAYFQSLGFSDTMISWLFAALWLACIVSPFIGGQIADRYFPTQYFLAGAHLIGAVLLFLMGEERSFGAMLTWMVVYCLLYAPTPGPHQLHLLSPSQKREPGIRSHSSLGNHRLDCGRLDSERMALRLRFSGPRRPVLRCSVRFAAARLTFLPASSYSTSQGSSTIRWLSWKPSGCSRTRNFAVFMAIAFVVTTELQFYYVPHRSFFRILAFRASPFRPS